jgi:NMD protein affecting ribosome stability and mRNA decay
MSFGFCEVCGENEATINGLCVECQKRREREDGW